MSRESGKGNIEELPSGRFRARTWLADGRRHNLGVFDSYDEAEHAIAAAVKVALEGQLAATGGGATFKGFGGRYMEELAASRYLDQKTARSAWNNWICEAPFINWPIRRIGKKQIQEWIKAIALAEKNAKLSDSWFRQVLGFTRRILDAAVEAELLTENPATDVRVPKRDARTDEAWTWLTLSEQRAILTTEAIPEYFRLTVAIVFGTGMRGGEAWLLHLKDVHLDGDDPHIWVRYGARKGSKLRAPKGRKIRKVPLLPVARDALRRWLEVLPTYAPRNPLGLVFPGPRGGYQKVSRWPGWKKHLAAAGITRRVRPHDLRHTAGSSLVSGLWGRPWRLHEVRDFLGHLSVEETERYAHLAPEAMQSAAASTTWSPLGSMPGPCVSNLSVISGGYEDKRVSDGGSRQSQQNHIVRPPNGPVMDPNGLAGQILAAVAAGKNAGHLADELASEVLVSLPVRLARKVLAGGEHARSAALELANLLTAPARATGEGSGEASHG